MEKHAVSMDYVCCKGIIALLRLASTGFSNDPIKLNHPVEVNLSRSF